MSMLQASIRKTGPLGAKINRIRAERIAAGLLKDDEKQPEEPIVLISENGSKQREDKHQELRKPVVRRLIHDDKPKVATDAGNHPTMDLIIETVRGFYSVSDADFRSRRGPAPAVTARLMAAYLCKTMTLNSFQSIARKFDGRDHATIFSAVRSFTAKLAKDADVAADLSRVVCRINAITHGGGEVISDQTQLAALEMAKDLARKRVTLTPSQCDLFDAQIDAIRQRIIDAADRRDTNTEARQ